MCGHLYAGACAVTPGLGHNTFNACLTIVI